MEPRNLPQKAKQQHSLVKQNEQNSLSAFVTIKEELDIVKCIEESKRLDSYDSREDVINMVIKWRMYIGIPKADVSEELAINAAFILENYGFLTLQELELAIKLSITGRLKDCEFHGYFSPMYAAKVIQAYLFYRKITLAEPIRKMEKSKLEEEYQKKKPSPEEEAELTKEIFRSCYAQWKKTGEITDVFNVCYKHLRKFKLMKVTQQLIDDAKEYGLKKAFEVKKNHKLGIDFNAMMEQDRWARNYCVQKYFENVDIEDVCKNITASLFS